MKIPILGPILNMILGNKSKKTVGAIQNHMGSPQELAAQGLAQPGQGDLSNRDAAQAMLQAGQRMLPGAA